MTLRALLSWLGSPVRPAHWGFYARVPFGFGWFSVVTREAVFTHLGMIEGWKRVKTYAWWSRHGGISCGNEARWIVRPGPESPGVWKTHLEVLRGEHYTCAPAFRHASKLPPCDRRSSLQSPRSVWDAVGR